MPARVKVDILVSPGCSSRQQTEELVRNVIDETGCSAKVEIIEVKNVQQVVQLQFLGSPSVRIDGIDVEPSAREKRNYGLG